MSQPKNVAVDADTADIARVAGENQSGHLAVLMAEDATRTGAPRQGRATP